MVKAKSPIAARTRARTMANSTAIIKRKDNFAISIKISRLTEEQIMTAMESGVIESLKPTYSLRKRDDVALPKKQEKKRVTPKTVMTKDDMPAARLWGVLKKENSLTVIKKDLFCLAKMKKYSPWPAMVLKPGKMVQVYFFGEGTTGNVPATEIVPFEKCSSLVKKYFNLKGYVRAVRELEIMLNVPQHASITKDV